MSATNPVVGPLGSARVVAAMRDIRTAPSRKQAAFVANGSAIPIANRNAPIGGADQLVGQEHRALDPGVAEPEVLATARGSGGACCSRSPRRPPRSPSANRAIRTIAMLDRAGDDRVDEDRQHRGAAHVGDDDHPLPVDPIGHGAAGDAEEQERQVLAQDGERDEEGVAGHRGDEQRPRGDRDAVAEVVDERRREQPAEAAAEPRWGDGLGRPGRHQAHRAEDSSPVGRRRLAAARRPLRDLDHDLAGRAALVHVPQRLDDPRPAGTAGR